MNPFAVMIVPREKIEVAEVCRLTVGWRSLRFCRLTGGDAGHSYGYLWYFGDSVCHAIWASSSESTDQGLSRQHLLD